MSNQQTGSSFDIEAQHNDDTGSVDFGKSPITEAGPEPITTVARMPKLWQALGAIRSFGGRRRGPPPEASAYSAELKGPLNRETSIPSIWNLLGRLEDFASVQAERFRDRKKPPVELTPLPVTRIPAPPRRRTLPEISEQLESEEENQDPAPNIAASAEDSQFRNVQIHGPQRTSHSSQQSSRPEPSDNADIITRRGRLSFAEAIHSDWEHREHQAIISVPADTSLTRAPQDPRPNSVQQGRTSPPKTTSSAGLPVLRIPAPQRTRPPEERPGE